MSKIKFEQGTKYEIFVGIKDKDNYQEILSTDDFIKILMEICKEKKINFSLITQFGGYSHNKGYTSETSLRVVIIGIDEEEVILLGEKLKHKINTDTVLISKMEIEYLFM